VTTLDNAGPEQPASLTGASLTTVPATAATSATAMTRLMTMAPATAMTRLMTMASLTAMTALRAMADQTMQDGAPGRPGVQRETG
jgi:hypothetical protein